MENSNTPKNKTPTGRDDQNSELSRLLGSIMDNYVQEAKNSKLTPETKVKIIREYLKELTTPEEDSKDNTSPPTK